MPDGTERFQIILITVHNRQNKWVFTLKIHYEYPNTDAFFYFLFWIFELLTWFSYTVFHPLIFHAWWNTIINMKHFTSITYICRPPIGPKYLTEKYVLFMELTRQFSRQYSNILGYIRLIINSLKKRDYMGGHYILVKCEQ
jgi:hypothetical protein